MEGKEGIIFGYDKSNPQHIKAIQISCPGKVPASAFAQIIEYQVFNSQPREIDIFLQGKQVTLDASHITDLRKLPPQNLIHVLKHLGEKMTRAERVIVRDVP